MSLRTKILLAVAIVHVCAFVPLAVILGRESSANRTAVERVREQQIQTLTRLVQSTIARTEPRDVAKLANWPFRDLVQTGLIVQRSDPGGVALQRASSQAYNLARPRRPADLDEEAARKWIDDAVRSGRVIPVDERSYAVPIRAEGDPRPWGGAYLVFEGAVASPNVAGLSTGALLVSLVVISALLHGLLSWLVLRPVEALSAGAERVARGDYHEPVPEAGTSDEMGSLILSFNSMMDQVGSFSKELSREVEVATAKALVAERQLQQVQRLASTGRLAAGIAHEINNPLGGLINATHSLRHKALPLDRQRLYLELIAEGLERIQGIVGRVLQFTPRQTEPEDFALAAAYRSARGLALHRVEREGVRLVDEDVDENAIVLGHLHELQQVFLNLVLNALDALLEGHAEGEDATIRVSIREEGDRVIAEVTDNGPGVAGESLGQLQEIFFSTKEVGKGTGLGLSLCAGIVENHAGRFELNSEPGRGFSARIDLPRASVVPPESS